ncbi:MAG: BrnA antitoxin family protein [Pseudomonadota bacterium]
MSVNWVPTKGPKNRRMAEARLHHLLSLHSLANDSVFLDVARKEIPEAWHVLEADIEVEAPKEKVTLYLDRAVIAMFRKMGKGYQARINRILETWVQMKMAEKMCMQREVIDEVKAARADMDRPDAGRAMDEIGETLLKEWAYLEGWNNAMRRKQQEAGK